MTNGRYKTLLQNTGLMFIGSFGSKIISFIMLPFYTMWLSVEDYGTSDIITVYSTVVLAFVSLCIGEAIFVVPSQKNKEQQQGYFTSSLVFSIFCVFVLCLLFIVVHFCFGRYSGAFVSNIYYICLITATTLYTTIFQQFCKAVNRMKVFATAGVVQTLFVALLGFLLIPKYHLDGYIWCILISNIITIFYVFFAGKLFEYVSVHLFSTEKLREMFDYSIPLIPNSVIWLIVSYLNRPVMESALGLYAIGIFSLANRFPSLINTIYGNFSNSWQISILEQHGKEGFSSFYNNVLLVSFCLMSLLVVALSLLIKPLVYLFLNSNYYEAIVYIPILCLSCLYISLASMAGAIFLAVRKSKYFFYSSIGSAIAAVIFNFLLITRFGIFGACWACVISYVVGGVARLYFANKFNKFYFVRQIIVLSILTTAMVCVISYLGNYYIGVAISIIIVLYTWYIVKKTNMWSLLTKKR